MENCRLSRCSIHQYTVRGSVLCIRILRIFRHSSVACRTCSAIAAVFAGHEKYAAASFPSRSFIYPFRFVLFERLAVFTSACSKPGLNRLFPLSAQYHPRGAVIAFSFLLQPSGSFSSFATFGSPSSEKTSWFFMLFLSFDFLVSTKPRQNPGFNEPRLSIPSLPRLALSAGGSGLPLVSSLGPSSRCLSKNRAGRSREIRYPA